MKSVIETIARALVESPDEVQVTEIDGEKTIIFELRCNPQDVGKVIGKGGKTVGSMRTILNAMASRRGCKAVLEVVD